MNKYAPIILRIGMSLVFLWFGAEQLLEPKQWVDFLPAWTLSLPMSQLGFVYLNGVFELAFGTLLLFGFYTRASALLLGLHLLGITIDVGYNAVGVRDFGLSVATLVIFLFGSDSLSLDTYFAKKGSSSSSVQNV